MNIFLIILSLESQWQISFDYRQLKSTSGNILRVADEENDGILRVRLESGRLLFSSNFENNANLTSSEKQIENIFYEPIRLEGESSNVLKTIIIIIGFIINPIKIWLLIIIKFHKSCLRIS